MILESSDCLLFTGSSRHSRWQRNEELDENNDVRDAGEVISDEYCLLFRILYLTESILVRVDLDIVKNPSPVIG